MTLPRDAAEALARLEMFGVRMGLARTARLLAALGDPQDRLPAVLVAGTNGKGSVAATLAAIGTAAGYRTGLYTSPHLEEVEERLRIDDEPVPGDRLGRRLLEVLAAAGRDADGDDGDPPTYFEVLTAAAFAELAGAGVELAVLEVGLGGRLDATNLADPALSVITPISLEHRQVLGDTLTAITHEKAGILRRGRPAVAWSDEPEVVAALDAEAATAGAHLHWAQREARLHGDVSTSWSGQSFGLATPIRRYRLTTPLLGAHQQRNMALAVRAAEMLATLGWERIDDAAVAAGVAAVRWPGRLEPVELPPGAGPRRVLLDAGHNPAAALAVASALGALATAGGNAPPDLLFGLLADKDAAGVLPPLLAATRRAVLTRPPHERGRDPEELLPLVPANAERPVVEADLETALDRALGLGGDTLLVCGSFYLVGAVRSGLRRRFGVPPAA
jgi:dihydrofolate synthase/folylpolyglutamate synthase